MNKSNEAIKTALSLATGALFELDDQGVLVLDVEINDATPTLTVDRAPPSARPGTSVTTRQGNQQVTFSRAAIRGCRVQWESIERFGVPAA